ncbi:MAG: hypothetical protein GY781_21630, partial [Gammaproteobacteria bacterium]|nr:hypothetical protein [Candidatus Scalindua sp.]MCP4274534.1 hypothetical protein [Gammaproteobacteria bacterium]
MKKYLSITCIALTIACITFTTGYAHEGTELSTEDLASQIGKTEAELKEIDKKIIEYNEKVIANQSDADAHFNLGVLYEQKMKFNDAISEYQKTIQLKPDSIEARINLSLVYTERNM